MNLRAFLFAIRKRDVDVISIYEKKSIRVTAHGSFLSGIQFLAHAAHAQFNFSETTTLKKAYIVVHITQTHKIVSNVN